MFNINTSTVYKPNSGNVGTFFKFEPIFYSQLNIENITCLNGEILHFYPLNELISNLMPATGLKKVGTGQQRAKKARHFEKIQLGEHLATN